MIQDPAARGELLYKLADLIERDRAYIAALETLNNGKPFKDSYYVDIPHCIAVLRYKINFFFLSMFKTFIHTDIMLDGQIK